jgi:hypothetical protein
MAILRTDVSKEYISSISVLQLLVTASVVPSIPSVRNVFAKMGIEISTETCITMMIITSIFRSSTVTTYCPHLQAQVFNTLFALLATCFLLAPFTFRRPRQRQHVPPNKQTPWPLVRERTIPTDRPLFVEEI